MRSLIVLFCSLSVLGASELVLPLSQSAIEPDPAVRWGQLENGLIYGVMENHEPADKVTLRLYVDAGSAQERDPERGLAHFLEHMAFNGSANYPAGQLIEILQAAGIAFGSGSNAHTGFEETVYKLELPDAKPETIALGMSVMADWAGRLTLEEAEVERERGVIEAEMRDRDGPGIRMARAFYTSLYPGLNFADRFPIGVAETVAAIDAAMLRSFYDRWYRPAAMVYTVVGAVDPEAIAGQIETTFADLNARADLDVVSSGELDGRAFATLAFHDAEAASTSLRYAVVRSAVEVPDSLERRRNDLLRSLAASILNRRLSEIAEAGEAPILDAGCYFYEHLGMFHAMSGVTVRPGEALAAVPVLEQEFRRMLEFGPTSSELATAVAQSLTSMKDAVAKVATRSNRGLAGQLYSSVRDREVFLSPQQVLELYEPMLAEVTAADVHAAFRAGYVGEHHLLALGGKDELGPDGETLLAEAWTSSQQEAVDAPAAVAAVEWGYADHDTSYVIREQTRAQHDIEQVQFANEVRANVMRRDAKPNEVLVSVRMQLPPVPHQAGLREFASMSYRAGGLGKHDLAALRELMSQSAVRIGGPSFADDAVTFSASCTPEELEFALQRLRAWILDPGWRESAFVRAKTSWLESLAVEHRNLDQVMSRHWQLHVYGGAPQRRSASLPEAAAVSREAVIAWLTPILERAPIEVSVVGDVDGEQALAALGRQFGSMPMRNALEVQPDLEAPGALAPCPPIYAGEHRIDVDSDVARAVVQIAWPTDDAADVKLARRLSALARVFDELLRKEVREALGEAYSPGAGHVSSDVYDADGYLAAYVGVAPGREEALLEILKGLAEKLVRDGIDDDLFERVHVPTLKSLDAYRDTNGYWLNAAVSRCQQQPQRLDWAAGMSEDFAAITPAELSALARAYLVPERALVLIGVSPGNETAAEAEATVESATAE